ncbi:hypothetical protein V7S43_015729 [Phytophthora oleae]|uniref:Uncharacterized protein n=1 Tax=Phytophthora oleae TaxID=2107226 RepID=A0ABD3EZ47_9STRA
MYKAPLLSVVRSLLPPDTVWPNDQYDIRLKDGKTVLMLVVRVSDPQLAVKLIDFVCPYTANFWARDSFGRHVIMDACSFGVHPSVLQHLIKWARRRYSPKMIVPMSRQDAQGLDAVELAIQGGHGALAFYLLGQRDPASRDYLLCVHYPLKVLELAIETGNETCARAVIANKRVVNHLQPGKTERLNLIARWTQRQTPVKRLFNVFTCVGVALHYKMPDIVRVIYDLNPEETRQAVWYAIYKSRAQSFGQLMVSPATKHIANSYLLDRIWSQLSVILLIRSWEVLARHERTCSLRERIRRHRQYRRRDWVAIAANPWTTLSSDVFSIVVSFLLPSEAKEAGKMAFLVEY